VMPDANADYEIIGEFDPDAGVYKKVVLRDGVIVGFSFADDIEKSGILSGLMRDKIDVSSFKDSLISADFDITVFPRELRKERLGIKPQMLAQVEREDQVEEYALE
jgi:NAD(P)H-nitrite reductase large subunit